MKNKKSVTFRDMYKDLDYDVSYADYKRILNMMTRLILEYIFERSECFKMPFGLGYICVCKYRPKEYTSKSLSVDYSASKEYDKRIYHLNEHYGGYKVRLYWSKIPKSFPDIYKYQLCLVRQNKRRLAELVFDKHDYINVDDIQLYKM